MTVNVAVLDDYQDVGRVLGPWDRLGDEARLTCLTSPIVDARELVSRLEPFDVVVAMRERTPLPRAVLEDLPNLKLLVTTGMGNAAIDTTYARERGVVVCGTGASIDSTVELTWALILALSRHLLEEDRAIRAGGWQHTLGPELSGRTLGIVGLGNSGQRMSALAAAFNMRAIAWSQNLTEDVAAAAGAIPVGKAELFRDADVVSIHYKLSSRSEGIVGAPEIALMKPTAFLVNTSRGPVVDEAALITALRHGRIAGAGLDVYDVEPLPAGHPLRSTPNTVLTPHIGYVAQGQYERWFQEIVEDIEAWLAGVPVRVIEG